MFIQEQKNELIYMRSDLLPVPHLFSTRYGGVSEGDLATMNILSNKGDKPENVRENFRRLAAVLGAGTDDCAVTGQVHGNTVRIVDETDRHVCTTSVPYDADGIATATPGLPLFCFTADCVPVLLCDPENRVIGAIHCGWRSSVGDILGNALEVMASLGASVSCVRAALGPAIGACHFETDDDVPDAITEWLKGDTEGLFVRRDDGKTLVDLRGANARRLVQLGVPVNQIDISDECTYCSHEKYWSHRWTKGRRGGQCAGIVLPAEE